MSPIKILGNHSLLQRGGDEVLVQWDNAPADEATWEDRDTFLKTFPTFDLKDKVSVEGESNDTGHHEAQLEGVQLVGVNAKRQSKKPTWMSDYVWKILSSIRVNQQIQRIDLCYLILAYISWHQDLKFLIKMPLRKSKNLSDVYEQKLKQRIMERMEERLDQFVDQLADLMNDMMNPRRRGDRNGRRSEGEESENPFFEGDGSSSDEQPDRPRTLFAEPIIWDIGDEKEEYPFVDNYLNFQEDENNVPFSSVVLGVEEESMPIYDTDIEDVIEEEEGFVRKGGFGGEEDSIEDIVVVANDLCSLMIQTTLSVYFEEYINTKSHELMSFGKSIIIK
ncbi:hypothetical protein Tco_0955791, partial [Tanacetum coccineum]